MTCKLRNPSAMLGATHRLFLLLLLVAVTPFLQAQVATGRIGGTVTDTSGAIISGATVTITDA